MPQYLTPQEKVKIRAHMGYLNVAEAYTFVAGTPAGVETQFLIEGAMNRVLEDALPEVRRIVQVLDTIEAQKVEDLEVAIVNSLGEININQNEQKQLDLEYEKWQARLSNLLGCPVNPWDKRKEVGPGMNIPVMH